MIDTCGKAGRKLMIAYRMQYDPVWQQAFDIVRSGALGKVQSFRGSMLQSQVLGWRQTKQYGGGGPMMDLGVVLLWGIVWLADESGETLCGWWLQR
jgi:predicted dehydrogenase